MFQETTNVQPLLRPLPALPVSSYGNVIGRSKELRTIYCLPRGRLDAPLKVLIVAGQHGDERPARRTVERLLAVPTDVLAARLPNLQLAVIPEANPDGCALRSRCNADGVDLNRDHQLLLSEEATALHRLVRQWQPNVVLDLHSYPSRRLHLLARNVVLDHDVFLDVPSHPAILARSGSVDPGKVLNGLLRAVAQRHVHAGRYTVVDASGRARHSTSDVVDARNGLALRYGVFSVLVENRQPRHDDGPTERARLRSAQEQALCAILEWLDQQHGWFPPPNSVALPAMGSPVPVNFKYATSGHRLHMACRDARRGLPASVIFPHYSVSLEARCAVQLPSGYAVPVELVELKRVLNRHGFVSSPHQAERRRIVESLQIGGARRLHRPERPLRKISVVPFRLQTALHHYEVFPTRQPGGDALAVYLEPESKHGLHRFPAMQLPLQADSWYPVLRVYDGPGPSDSHQISLTSI